MKLVANIFAVVVLLGLLAAIVIPAVTHCGAPKEISITGQEMRQTYFALLIYHEEYGQLPTETDNARLVQILEGDNPRKLKFYTLDRKRSKNGQFIDGWDKPLLFIPNAKGLLIRSAGRDGRYYTEDDITQEVQVQTQTTASAQK